MKSLKPKQERYTTGTELSNRMNMAGKVQKGQPSEKKKAAQIYARGTVLYSRLIPKQDRDIGDA